MNEDIDVSKIKKVNALEFLEKWFGNSVSSDSGYRDNATVWYQYYHGQQWTDEETSALEARGQAVTTYNHIKPTIDAVIGGEGQNRPKTTMAGREPSDAQIADIKSKLYDFIQYNTDTDIQIDKAELDILIAGRGWVNVYPEMNGKVFKDLMHQFVDYRDMYLDPLSKRDDLKDARYLHHAIYVDVDILEKNFKDFDKDNMSNGSAYGQDFGFEGSSEENMWFEKGDRERPRLIQTWYRDEKDVLHSATWVKGQVLDLKKVPYEFTGYPYAMTTLNRDLENKPYGLVKGMISAQDEVNKRHSKALHYLNTKQVIAEEDAFVDWNDAEKTLAKPDGVVKASEGAVAEGRILLQDNQQLANAHIQLMEIAKDKLLATAGLNAGVVGQSGQYESAKKNGQNIAQAQNVLVPFLKKIRAFRYDIAYITMNLVPQFYDEERTLRILAPNGTFAFQPVNVINMLADGTFERQASLTSNDVDIIIEDAPSSLSEQDEQFQMLLQIQGQTGKPIPMDILLRYSKLKDKHQLAEDLKASYDKDVVIEQQQQQMAQMEQQIQQLGGQVNQQQQQIVAVNTAREVDKAVDKATQGLNI